jgi:hypothetical protein
MDKDTADNVKFLESVVFRHAAENLAFKAFLRALLIANPAMNRPQLEIARLQFASDVAAEMKVAAQDVLSRLLAASP